MDAVAKHYAAWRTPESLKAWRASDHAEHAPIGKGETNMVAIIRQKEAATAHRQAAAVAPTDKHRDVHLAKAADHDRAAKYMWHAAIRDQKRDDHGRFA